MRKKPELIYDDNKSPKNIWKFEKEIVTLQRECVIY